MAENLELRVQPQDLLAEQSVLGSIFISPDKLITVREYVSPDDFYKYAHKIIFKAMIALSDRNEAIDATTVRTILDNQGTCKISVAYPTLLSWSIVYRPVPMRNIMQRLWLKKPLCVISSHA